MCYQIAVEKAKRHGWSATGVALVGNCCYTVLRRGAYAIAIHPVTARMFRITN